MAGPNVTEGYAWNSYISYSAAAIYSMWDLEDHYTVRWLDLVVTFNDSIVSVK